MPQTRRAALTGILATAVTGSGGLGKLAFAAPEAVSTELLFVSFPRFKPSSNVATIRSAGFREVGRGSAQYRRLRAGERKPDWGSDLWWTSDANGALWLLDERHPTSDMFGTARDATRTLDGVTTGTDDTERINALLRYAEEQGIGIAILAVGSHRVSGTIRVGQGTSFSSISFMGERPHPAPTLHDSQRAFPSAMLIADRNDRPCINVQGARASLVSDIVVYGPLRSHIGKHRLGRSDDAPTLVDDVRVEAWQDADPVHSYGRYNPGCGFAVDAWSGTAPADPYPNAAYGQPASSQVSIERCHCAGFTVAFAIKPSDDDSNGDFFRLVDSSFSECIYGVSIGNSQSRNAFVSNLNGANFHTALTNRRHGRQIGHFGGPILNCSFGQCIQLFDIETSRAGRFAIVSGYAEGLWRFGTAIGAGRVDIDGDFTLTAANALGGAMPSWIFPNRGLPMTHFSADADQETISRLTLRGSIQVATSLSIATAFCDYAGQMVSAERAQIYANRRSLPSWRAAGHDASGGGIIVQRNPYARSGIRIASSFALFDIDTGVNVTQADWDGETWGQSKRSQGCPATSHAILPSGGSSPVAIPLQPAIIDATHVSASLNARTLRLTLHPSIRMRQSALNLMVGTVILHDRSQLAAIIQSYDPDAGVIEAVIENGFKIEPDGTLVWAGIPPDLTGGQFALWSGNFFVPGIIGTFTAGSPTITDLTAIDDAMAHSDLVVGDLVVCDPMTGGTDDIEPRIISIDKSARSITLNTPAKRTEQRQMLLLRRSM